MNELVALVGGDDSRELALALAAVTAEVANWDAWGIDSCARCSSCVARWRSTGACAACERAKSEELLVEKEPDAGGGARGVLSRGENGSKSAMVEDMVVSMGRGGGSVAVSSGDRSAWVVGCGRPSVSRKSNALEVVGLVYVVVWLMGRGICGANGSSEAVCMVMGGGGRAMDEEGAAPNGLLVVVLKLLVLAVPMVFTGGAAYAKDDGASAGAKAETPLGCVMNDAPLFAYAGANPFMAMGGAGEAVVGMPKGFVAYDAAAFVAMGRAALVGPAVVIKWLSRGLATGSSIANGSFMVKKRQRMTWVLGCVDERIRKLHRARNRDCRPHTRHTAVENK